MAFPRPVNLRKASFFPDSLTPAIVILFLVFFFVHNSMLETEACKAVGGAKGEADFSLSRELEPDA